MKRNPSFTSARPLFDTTSGRSGASRPRALRRGGSGFLAAAVVGLFATAAGALAADPENVRVLSYNTALVYVQADHPSPIPPPELALTACVQCDPFSLPPLSVTGGQFCQCWPSMSLMPNRHRFGKFSEPDRAAQIAQRILETDQDIVALNEVFHPEARTALIDALAVQGPYSHYVSFLRGHAPVEGLTLGDILQMEGGKVHPILGVILQDLPGIIDYHAVSGDSGLMLFSKYPLLPLEGDAPPNDAVCGDPECSFGGSNQGAPLSPKEFAFKVFEECDEEDCWASKGVGLVKVDTPHDPTYVAFTHLQADYAQNDVIVPETRAAQYTTIRDTLLSSIPEGELIDARVFVVGDLNSPGFARTDTPTSQSQEWHDVFGTAATVADGFFGCGNGVDVGGAVEPCRFDDNGTSYLTDSWGFETSPTDLGYTNDHNGVRIDYVLHSPMDGGLCMQHSMIAWDLQAPTSNGAKGWLSDHLPVRGDFGPGAAWCSPNDDPAAHAPDRNVQLLSFGPTNCGASPNPPCHQDEVYGPPQASLSASGSFQWFRIDQAGTYSIQMTPTDSNLRVDFDVYHHTDLSRPIRPFSDEESDRGLTFGLPAPPYYIRTFAVDASHQPDRTGPSRSYTLSVHQHLCRDPLDACVLEPGRALDAPEMYTWPTTVGGSPGDPLTELRELWWKFKTSGVRDGRLVAGETAVFPSVRMQLESSDEEKLRCVTRVSPVIELWDDAVTPTQLLGTFSMDGVQIDTDGDWENDGQLDELHVAPPLPATKEGELQAYFLKVTRDSSYLDGFEPCNFGMTHWLGYLTDLTFIAPIEIEMWAELDDDVGADDDLRIHMGFDASGFTTSPPAAASVDEVFVEPDNGSMTVSLWGAPKLRGYYVNQVWPSLWEKDEEQLLGADSSFGGIGTLDEWRTASPDSVTDYPSFVLYADGPNGDEADYYYYFKYRRCRWHDAPMCDPGD